MGACTYRRFSKACFVIVFDIDIGRIMHSLMIGERREKQCLILYYVYFPEALFFITFYFGSGKS